MASNGQKLKQIEIASNTIAIGGSDGRGKALAPGSEAQVLTIVSGEVAWAAPTGGTFFKRYSFTEAGPSTATTGTHTLTTTLPAELQDGNKNSLIVMINGLGIDLSAVTLDGSGPYVVKINMATVGYSLDSNDTITVAYLAAV